MQQQQQQQQLHSGGTVDRQQINEAQSLLADHFSLLLSLLEPTGRRLTAESRQNNNRFASN